MKASSFSIINVYVEGLNTIFRKKASLLPFRFMRNFGLPCSSFPFEEEQVSSKWASNAIVGEKGFQHMTTQEEEMKMIKSVFVNCGWSWGLDFGILDELKMVKILNELFDETRNAALVFVFFKWWEKCIGSKHVTRSVCTMIHILVCGNMNYRAMDLIMYLVKNNHATQNWHHLLFDVLEETHINKTALTTVYSMLVSSFVGYNLISAALELVDRMKVLNIFLTVGVCNVLIRTLLESNNFKLAWDLLEEMLTRGMGNTSIVSLFICQYCAEGSLACAGKFLVEMENYGCKPDVVAYTIVIDAFCKRGLLREGTSLLFKMIKMGIAPDSVSVTPVVDAYCKTKSLEEAMDVLKVFGFPLNIFVYNSFISKLCRDGHMVEATELFHEMSTLGLCPDCCSYTTIISGYCKVANSNEAVSCKVRNLNKALMYLGQMLKRGFKLATVTYTVLIDSYCKIGELEMAEILFGMIKRNGLEPDVVTYNTLMDGYGKRGYVHKAFELLDMMKLAGVSPDVATYNIIIHAIAKRGFMEEAGKILDELIRRGLAPDILTFTNIIAGFSKKGNFEEAMLLWSHMSEHGMRPDVVTCSALLNGYCKKHRMEEAMVLFRKMLDAGLVPDLVLYNTLIDGFCSQGDIDDACGLISMMVENDIVPDNVTYCALVRGFKKHSVMHPVENAAIKMQHILLKNGIDVDVSKYISSLHQSSVWDTRLDS